MQLKAANHTRPVLRLLDYRTDQPDPFTISGQKGSRFTLDGLLITGRGIGIAGLMPYISHWTKGDDKASSTFALCQTARDSAWA